MIKPRGTLPMQSETGMFFVAVRGILERNTEDIARSRRLTDEKMLKKAASHLNIMREQWFSGEEPDITYEDPICRWAYVFAHVAVQSNLFLHVLRECTEDSALLTKLLGEQLSVTVLGGGPGTELLGLAKYYMDAAASDQEQVDIRVDIIDRVKAWAENVSWIKDEISTIYRKPFGKNQNGPLFLMLMPSPLISPTLIVFPIYLRYSRKIFSSLTSSFQRSLT
jgi:hypothetical protein